MALTGKTISQLPYVTYTSFTPNDLFIVDNYQIITGVTSSTKLSDLKNYMFSGITDVYVTGGTYNKGNYIFTNNTGGTFNVSATTTYSAGVISGATGWSSTGSGQINLPSVEVALFNNPNNIEPIKVYSISSGTTNSGSIPSLTDNSVNYIVIDYNGGNPKYDVLLSDSTINDSSIVLFMIIYRLGTIIHTLEFGNQGAGLPNKLNDRIIMTDRFARESGFSLGLSGATGIATVGSGVSWNGVNRQSLNAINSQDDIFFQNYHVGGSWVYTTSSNTINNQYYDNGTNPVLSSPGKFLVNWYFRGLEINDHIYEVWGNDEYNNVSEAQLSTEPILPELVSSQSFLLGRIIVGYTASTGLAESAFIKVFQGSQVQAHNDLTNIQGGGGGEYYHLTLSEYSNLPFINSNNVFQSGLTANTISASTYLNVPSFVNMVFAHSSVGPADATTYYIGALSNLTPSTANRDAWTVNSQYTGNITEVSIISNFGGGSSGNSTMTLFNLSAGTSQVITSTLQYISGTPVQILSEPFTGGTQPAGWSSSLTTFASGYAGLTGTTSTLTSPVFDGTAYASINIQSDVAKFGAGTDGPVLIEYSLNSGSTWTSGGTTAISTGSTNYVTSTVSIPTTSSQMAIRFSVNPTGTSGKRVRNVFFNGLSSSINNN